MNAIQFNYKDHWQEEEINFERPTTGDQSLGFRIAGGIKTPYVNQYSTCIVVIHINENGLVQRDKRLKLHDVILRVNNIEYTNIEHQKAVNILRTQGPKVQLLIRRLSPPIIEETEWEHNEKLGFTITGGFENEYYESDYGIFITKINKDQSNKQLKIGDRLLQISSTKNTYDLRYVTFEEALKYIQLARAESQKIKLYVAHASPIIQEQTETTVLHQNQSDQLDTKNENEHVEVNKNNCSTVLSKDQDSKIQHPYVNYETINAMLNKRHIYDSSELIQSFDLDDYLRYENRSKIRNNRLLRNQSINKSKVQPIEKQEQPHLVRFGMVPTVINPIYDDEININVQKPNIDQQRNFTENNSRNDIDEKQLKLYQATIREAQAEKRRREEGKISQRARMERNNGILNDNGPLKWPMNQFNV